MEFRTYFGIFAIWTTTNKWLTFQRRQQNFAKYDDDGNNNSSNNINDIDSDLFNELSNRIAFLTVNSSERKKIICIVLIYMEFSYEFFNCGLHFHWDRRKIYDKKKPLMLLFCVRRCWHWRLYLTINWTRPKKMTARKEWCVDMCTRQGGKKSIRICFDCVIKALFCRWFAIEKGKEREKNRD